MSDPPKRSRRTRLRRRWSSLAAALLLIGGGSAIAHLDGGDFPARSARVAGAPVMLRVQEGVAPHERRVIADALRKSHRYLRRVLGHRVRGPVEARIAYEDRCDRSAAADASVIGQGRAGYVCVDTANPHWRWLIRNAGAAAAAVPAHEYVHVLQGERNCLSNREQRDYRWLAEGMATHLGWQALVWSGDADDTQVRRAILRDDPYSNPRPLREYEESGGRTPQYALWHIATRRLLTHARSAGLVPGARPDAALVRFCELVGAGLGWRSAFVRSFGVSVYEFYRRFEALRP